MTRSIFDEDLFDDDAADLSMTERFQARLVEQFTVDQFPVLRKLPESEAFALEQALRDQVDRAYSTNYRGVRQIRITELVPRGMMLISPTEDYERRKVLLDGRCVGCPEEDLLVNPDDWELIVKTYSDHPRRLRNGCQYMGIPVFDDTIEARMRRAA